MVQASRIWPHFGYLSFEIIRTTKTSRFPMFPVFEGSDFGSPLYFITKMCPIPGHFLHCVPEKEKKRKEN